MDPMTIKLASLRLAPVQVTTWGHPETTGLPTIDYYLSAQAFEPCGAHAGYTERLLLLPNLGCAYEKLCPDIAEPDWSTLGVTAETPLLLCAGTPFKYAPEHDWIFAEIARQTENCR